MMEEAIMVVPFIGDPGVSGPAVTKPLKPNFFNPFDRTKTRYLIATS
jgi:hypothetical protein